MSILEIIIIFFILLILIYIFFRLYKYYKNNQVIEYKTVSLIPNQQLATQYAHSQILEEILTDLDLQS